ncbi:GNAT family N-acetyltransferase [Rhodobacterales bacterium HKCCSP123]|nr:GNAT family N-acetyltransferase [Rhodobacterales bacterium HKCCSP123]
MDVSDQIAGQEPAIAALFASTFTASEAAEEGAVIGALVARLLSDVPRDALRAFTASDKGKLVGGVIFTPLTYPDPRRVMLLSPMAVAPDRQGEGIGQRLIAHALDRLRAEGTDVAVTYGDPAFYGKTGFAPVSEAVLPAPMPLSHPQGWIAQSLTDAPLSPVNGPAACVRPFRSPELW